MVFTVEFYPPELLILLKGRRRIRQGKEAPDLP